MSRPLQKPAESRARPSRPLGGAPLGSRSSGRANAGATTSAGGRADAGGGVAASDQPEAEVEDEKTNQSSLWSHGEPLGNDDDVLIEGHDAAPKPKKRRLRRGAAEQVEAGELPSGSHTAAAAL